MATYSPAVRLNLQEVGGGQLQKLAHVLTIGGDRFSRPQAISGEFSMANWYLLRSGQTHGPYPEEQIRQWVRAGQIAHDEKLNREGDANWLSLDMIPEFTADRSAAPPPYAAGAKDKTVAAILAFVLGPLGVHHFYLGNTTIGIIYLIISLFSVGSVALVLSIIDGIMYLTKSEDQFQRCYMNWFCGERAPTPLP